MSSVQVFQVDAFTARRFAGNPAGVVLPADELTDQDMQSLARELNNGDTAFVLEPDGDDHDLRVRFFTPKREAAFVGHATLAVHAVLAQLKLAPRHRQKQKSGTVEVDTLGAAWPPRIAIHTAPPSLKRAPNDDELSAVLEALGLHASDLDSECPPMIAGDSSTRLLLGVADAAVLARLRPDLARLISLSDQIGAPGYFLFTRRPSMADVLTEARMFCPALGITEDPVSGNAHGLLGTYLLKHGLLGPDADGDADTVEFTGAQGHHVGRPGRVTIALNRDSSQLRSVSIIGEAVVVFQATLDF